MRTISQDAKWPKQVMMQLFLLEACYPSWVVWCNASEKRQGHWQDNRTQMSECAFWLIHNASVDLKTVTVIYLHCVKQLPLLFRTWGYNMCNAESSWKAHVKWDILSKWNFIFAGREWLPGRAWMTRALDRLPCDWLKLETVARGLSRVLFTFWFRLSMAVPICQCASSRIFTSDITSCHLCVCYWSI